MRGKASVFLIGPMGSGKTAVGRHLARCARIALLRQRRGDRAAHGRGHPLHLREGRRGGFPAARARGHRGAHRRSRAWCSPPGAARCCSTQNRRCLAERGRVVYLETSVTQQAHRVRYGRNRPLLADGDAAARLAQLMAARGAAVRRDRRHRRLDRRAACAGGRRAHPARARRAPNLSRLPCVPAGSRILPRASARISRASRPTCTP